MLSLDAASRLRSLVLEVRERCPGQTEWRYLNYLRQHASLPQPLRDVREEWEAKASSPLLVSGLPTFKDIEDSKILTLILGESVGNRVAYSDYNGSYITDIRPTELSSEKSARRSLLPMHNDLSWASDKSRPRTLALLVHRAKDKVPRTLLAPAEDVLHQLPPEQIETLSRNIYDARVGSSPSWKSERVKVIGRIDLVVANAGAMAETSFTSDRGLAPEQRHHIAKAARPVVGQKRGTQFGR